MLLRSTESAGAALAGVSTSGGTAGAAFSAGAAFAPVDGASALGAASVTVAGASAGIGAGASVVGASDGEASGAAAGVDASTGALLKEFDLGPVWSGPSVSRGRVYSGSGNTQLSPTPEEAFFPKRYSGTLYCFGLPGDDEVSRMGSGNE